MASNDEHGSLKYAVWSDRFRVEKPYKVMSDLQPGFQKTNITYEDGPPQLFRDARGHESDFTLDSHGFAFCTHAHGFQDWDSQEAVEREYLPEVERLLKREIPGATRVKVFDWRLRRNQAFEDAGIEQIHLKTSWFPPVSTAHIDQTPWSAKRRVEHHLAEDSESLARKRLRIVNAWRPVKHAIEDWPLAVCDGRDVAEDDLLATDYVTLDFVGETYNVLFRDKYRWHYLSRQSPEEVTLIKISDSKGGDVQARHCPHASFEHKVQRQGVLPRESIEVRVLVFSDD
ncbi:hypothetical protein PG991_010618 [Apiospora marii]|uniref:Methyltransferase n=1 Tax=Apiospora marii TaxID=335849 RepID=A0ABR1RBS4_9PEZI